MSGGDFGRALPTAADCDVTLLFPRPDTLKGVTSQSPHLEPSCDVLADAGFPLDWLEASQIVCKQIRRFDTEPVKGAPE